LGRTDGPTTSCDQISFDGMAADNRPPCASWRKSLSFRAGT